MENSRSGPLLARAPTEADLARIARSLNEHGVKYAVILPTQRVHSIFRLLEIHEHHELGDDIEVHIVELPKLGLRTDEPRLDRWVRFLSASSEAELQELAMTDPEIGRAKEALDALSRDPAARELALQREMSQINLAIMRQFEREDGEAKGYKRGKLEGLVHAIRTVAELSSIEIDAARGTQIEQMDAPALQNLIEALVRDRRWPDE